MSIYYICYVRSLFVFDCTFSVFFFFFFKQKTAYEMRISDWSSDVCSSDLFRHAPHQFIEGRQVDGDRSSLRLCCGDDLQRSGKQRTLRLRRLLGPGPEEDACHEKHGRHPRRLHDEPVLVKDGGAGAGGRSEEHTSELQSLMRISYAVFCLKKKK